MLAQQGVFQVDNYSLDELTQVAGTHGRVVNGKYVPFTESELRNQVQFEKFSRLLGDDALGHTIWNRTKFGVNWGDQTVAKAVAQKPWDFLIKREKSRLNKSHASLKINCLK